MQQFKYAPPIKYEYQKVQCQYQTFNRSNAQLSHYPIVYSSADLTAPKDQEPKDLNTTEPEPAKEETPAEASEETPAEPTEEAPVEAEAAPEPEPTPEEPSNPPAEEETTGKF